jgi:flagellar biosynthesis protein FlhF
MKIKTYSARDMRTALRLVREEQGPDAVILSTRNGPQGVEVEVAIDVAEAAAPGFADLLVREAITPATKVVTAAANAPVAAAPVATMVETPRVDAEINAELRSMRHLLETQLGRLAWNDLSRRSPAQAELLKQLTEIGLAEDLASQLVQELPANLAFDEAQRRTLAQLSRRVAVTGDDLLDNGGRVAFIGPTGVGKTTVIAKLAARWIMRHGPRDIALVSTDSQRFGAQEQLRVLGRLLGVEAFCVEDVAQLPDLLARLSARRFVLIDTAGQSPRDAELAARAAVFAKIAAGGDINVCLTLSCGAQAGLIADAVARFGAYGPSMCVLTKLDEASSLGGTLSALVKHQLPVSYISDGQRIPEDLNPARAHQLVSRAVQLTRIAGATAGEDLLTRRFGGLAHGIA